MRRIITCSVLILISISSNAQNVGIGTNTPDPSAKLEVSSNNSGFLPPRMTTTERNTIANPAVGLQIYNTSTDCLEIFGRGKWNAIYCVPVDSSTLVTDIDGHTYPTVQICNQTWMAKNLDVARYRNGDIIPQVTDANEWSNLTTGAWCWYNNDSAGYGSIYGRLYNWYAVNDPRGLAPEGWHVSSDGEWNNMTKCLDANTDTTCFGCSQSSIVGGSLKEVGIEHWISPNLTTTSVGFNGLAGGYRVGDGYFYSSIGIYGYWWSSTISNLNSGWSWSRFLKNDISDIYRNYDTEFKDGFSIRCVKDIPPSSTIDSGLVAYYPFNGNANDESGNGNNGTVNGASLTTDRFGNSGKAYSFDGINNNILISSLNNMSYKPITYHAWVNPNELNTISYRLGGGLVIMGRDWAGYENQGALMIYDYPVGGVTNDFIYYIGQSGATTSYTPNLNEWTSVTMTISNQDSIKFYINGVLVNSQYFSTNSNLNGPFKLGSGTDVNINSNRFLWKGKLDDIRIYNRALTQAEISYLATH